MKKYIAYYRVSTKRQGASGLGLDAQRDIVNQFTSGGGTILKHFVEVESGRKNVRPQLDQAIEYAKINDAELLIAKLDRLSRNVAFILRLRETGIRFTACDLPDANTLTIGVIGGYAQFEWERISTRIKDALAAKKRRGESLGNTANLTNEGRALGASAMQRKAANSTLNKQVLAHIQSFRQQRMTFWGIANEINKLGYKTPRGKEWKAGSVKILLDRSMANTCQVPVL